MSGWVGGCGRGCEGWVDGRLGPGMESGLICARSTSPVRPQTRSQPPPGGQRQPSVPAQPSSSRQPAVTPPRPRLDYHRLLLRRSRSPLGGQTPRSSGQALEVAPPAAASAVAATLDGLVLPSFQQSAAAHPAVPLFETLIHKGVA